MNCIWVFGDSFSTPFDSLKLGDWSKEYIKWKGYVPKTFGTNLSDRLNMNVNNFAIGGMDNYTIFDNIIINAPNFKKGDIIIVGWSDIIRFRLAGQENKLKFILPNVDNSKLIKGLTQDTINQILVNRTNPWYFEEFIIKFNFLNWLLKDYIFIQWSPFLFNLFTEIYKLPFVKFVTKNVYQETNGKINDTHLSELGHLEITEHFMLLINNEDSRKENNKIISNKKIL
jgi:hypothetical protein